MVETLLGGLLGGVFRIIPEGIKFFDAKNDRKHELEMTRAQIEHTKAAGQTKIEEVRQLGQNEYDVSAIKALAEISKAQHTDTGVPWVNAVSALVRPVITLQWVILLYPAAIIASFILAVTSGVPVLIAIGQTFGTEEKAICAGIINFWFLNRVFEKASRH